MEISQGAGFNNLLDMDEGRRRLAAYATPVRIEDWAGPVAGPAEIEKAFDLAEGLRNVDAIFVPEPFLSQALADPDNELLGYNFQDSVPGLPTLVTYTSDKLIQEDPQLVSDFQSAMDDVLAQAGPHAKEAHGVDVTPELAGQIRRLVRDA